MIKNSVYFIVIMVLFWGIQSPCIYSTRHALAQEITEESSLQEGIEVDDNILLDFENRSMKDLIDMMVEITGKNFIYGSEVERGTISISSSFAVPIEYAYEILKTVLAQNGFAVIPVLDGEFVKIVSAKGIYGDIKTLLGDEEAPPGDELVTWIYQLESQDSQKITGLLNNMRSTYGALVAYEPLNMIIVTDFASVIARMKGIIEKIDLLGVEFKREMKIIDLKYSNAKAMAALLTDILSLGEQQQKTARKRTTRGKDEALIISETEELNVVPVVRTNSLIVIGTAQDIDYIEEIINKLDIPPVVEAENLHVYKLQYADAQSMQKKLEPLVKQAKAKGGEVSTMSTFVDEITIVADDDNNFLLITAVKQDYDVLRGIIEQLDIMPRQVFVEAVIMRVELTDVENLGVNLAAFNDTDVGGATSTIAINPISAIGGVTEDGVIDRERVLAALLASAAAQSSFLIGGIVDDWQPNVAALLAALQSITNVEILDAPQLMTSDNQKATIFDGKNVPVIKGKLTDRGTGVSDSSVFETQIERANVGVTLEVKPQINAGDTITLEINQKVEDLLLTGGVGDIDTIGPSFSTEQIKTTVIVSNHEPIIIGGIRGDGIQKSVTKVPILGDIPLLGLLFRGKTEHVVKTNLVVIITPHIVKSVDDMRAIPEKKIREYNDDKTKFSEKRFYEGNKETINLLEENPWKDIEQSMEAPAEMTNEVSAETFEFPK